MERKESPREMPKDWKWPKYWSDRCQSCGSPSIIWVTIAKWSASFWTDQASGSGYELALGDVNEGRAVMVKHDLCEECAERAHPDYTNLPADMNATPDYSWVKDMPTMEEWLDEKYGDDDD